MLLAAIKTLDNGLTAAMGGNRKTTRQLIFNRVYAGLQPIGQHALVTQAQKDELMEMVGDEVERFGGYLIVYRAMHPRADPNSPEYAPSNRFMRIDVNQELYRLQERHTLAIPNTAANNKLAKSLAKANKANEEVVQNALASATANQTRRRKYNSVEVCRYQSGVQMGRNMNKRTRFNPQAPTRSENR